MAGTGLGRGIEAYTKLTTSSCCPLVKDIDTSSTCVFILHIYTTAISPDASNILIIPCSSSAQNTITNQRMIDQESETHNVVQTQQDQDATKCPSPPFVTVDGVPNFRDLGGKCCIYQRSTDNESIESTSIIRSGYLYRCAQPTHIIDAGRETVRSTVGVQDIYDLRSFKELRLMSTRYPDASLEIAGVQRHHVPIFKDEDYTPISLANKYSLNDRRAATSNDIVTSLTDEGPVQAYHDILLQAAKSGAFRTILLHVLHHPSRPLAVHCTAGKDRTGIFSALLLSLCGVRKEDIVTDYAYTTGWGSGGSI